MELGKETRRKLEGTRSESCRRCRSVDSLLAAGSRSLVARTALRQAWNPHDDPHCTAGGRLRPRTRHDTPIRTCRISSGCGDLVLEPQLLSPTCTRPFCPGD